MPTAVIAFDFDPLLHLGDGGVRWETIAIAVTIFAALVVAGVAARSAGLRVDDLLFVVLGVVPGAVIGGRIGYVLLHPAFFQADPVRLVDPGVGSLELTLAVAGGLVTGALVAMLLDARPGQWLHVSALPMLLALSLGKLAMVLGGSGQGRLTSGEPATAYLGPGPWGSLGPDLPSIPSQAIEGLATALILALVVGLAALPSFRRRDGRLALVAVGLWAVSRALVASTWRDPPVAAGLRAEQLIDIVVAVAVTVAAIVVVQVGRRRALVDAAVDHGDPGFGSRIDAEPMG